MLPEFRARDYIDLRINFAKINSPDKNRPKFNNNTRNALPTFENKSREFHKIASPPDSFIDDDHILVRAVLVEGVL